MSDTTGAEVTKDAGLRISDLEQQIITFIQKEVQDKSAVLTRDTRRDEVAIDSIDVVNVVFAVEEKYDIEVDLTPDAKFETVGELVDALISFIPEEKRALS